MKFAAPERAGAGREGLEGRAGLRGRTQEGCEDAGKRETRWGESERDAWGICGRGTARRRGRELCRSCGAD